MFKVVIDVTYSPDDKGWYCQVWAKNTGVELEPVTKTYKNKVLAIDEMRSICKTNGWTIDYIKEV